MFTITEEQRNNLLNYLKKKPWDEVVQLISMVASLKPVEEKDDTKKDLS